MGIGVISKNRLWVVGGLVGGLLLVGGCSSSVEPAAPKVAVTTPAATTPAATTAKATTTTKAPTTTTTVAPTTTTVAPIAPPPATAEQIIAPEPVVAPPKPAAREAPSVSFSSCAAARAAGVAPLYSGDPGYSTKLDRDRDGVACE